MTAPFPPDTRWRPSRRSSFARRDSNLALVSAVVAGAVIALAVLLFLIQLVNPDQGRRLRGAAADLAAPVATVVAAPFRLLGAGLDRAGDHWQAVRRLRALEAALAEAEARAASADQLAGEVARLEALLNLQRPARRVVATGMASAQVPSAGSRIAVVNVGLHHGVRPQMPVIAAGGLAGRVSDVGLAGARIILVTDASSRVPVRVVRNGWTGLVAGRGGRLLDFLYDPGSGDDRLRVGDRLVTSGDGGLFPPGVPVGVVVDIATEPPRVRPLANPAAPGPVAIEAPWMPPPEIVAASPALPEADRPLPADLPAAAAPGMADAGR